MRVYFDSSALIAAFVSEEIHHDLAADALSRATEGLTSNHALSEVFATLTGGRLNLQLTPVEATQVIEHNVFERLEIVELKVGDYRKAISESQTVGARGGAIFDMLHLQAARRGRAERVYTINVRHFQVFAPDLKERISLPM